MSEPVLSAKSTKYSTQSGSSQSSPSHNHEIVTRRDTQVPHPSGASAAIRLVNNNSPRVTCSIFITDATTVIGRTIVNENNLEILVGLSLKGVKKLR